MDNNYPKDYTKKYWKEVYQESYDAERKKLDARGEIMRRIFSIALGCIGVGLLVAFGILKLQGQETIAGVVFVLFIGDIIGFVGMLISIPVLAYLNKSEISARKYWKKLEEIKQLEPVEANIEIIVPSNVFGDGDVVKLIILNKNTTADIEKCYARFEYIGLFSIYNNQVRWFKFGSEHYQKNVLWDKPSFEDGTITISAGGKDVLNIANVVSDGFNFLFQNGKTYKQSIQRDSCNYLIQLKLFGHLNGHPIKVIDELYTIHFAIMPTHVLKHNAAGKPLSDDILDYGGPKLLPHFQIKKAEINTSTEIKEDKGIEINLKDNLYRKGRLNQKRFFRHYLLSRDAHQNLYYFWYRIIEKRKSKNLV